MKLRNLVVLIIVFLSYVQLANAQKTIQNVEGRDGISLNGRWSYIIDPYKMGYLDYRLKPHDESENAKGGFYDNLTEKDLGKTDRAEYNFDYEATMQIPGDWNSQDLRLKFYEGTVWFRRNFNFEPKSGKKYYVHFAAVNYFSNVYLNGKKIGSHKGGFTPFQFDVTELLIKGENSLVIMVENTRMKDEIPTTNTDWWNYGGITRDVTLVELSESYISDYKVQLAKGNKNTIKGFVELEGAAKGGEISIEIPELRIKKQLKSDGENRVEFTFKSNRIKLWSPENPKLYDVVISTESDEIKDRIGFRTIETKGKDILLNGKSIFLKGISIHDENPLIEGRLRSEGDMRMMLDWAKELGCNYVRLAHYTHSETMLRLADEMGLMVWAEVPVYWTISWTNPGTLANAKNQLAVSIERDKNRASAIIWSVGNETPVTEERNVFMSTLVDEVRGIDDTRLISAALEVEMHDYSVTVDDTLGDKLDVVSFNEYGGWYWSNAQELPKYSFDIKFNKPVIISEFGAGALGGFYADSETMWSEEYQELIYINQLKMLDKIDGLRGMTPWILVDFKSPRRQHPVYQNFWNRKGLMSETGHKKKAYFILQDYYKNKKVK